MVLPFGIPVHLDAGKPLGDGCAGQPDSPVITPSSTAMWSAQASGPSSGQTEGSLGMLTIRRAAAGVD